MIRQKLFRYWPIWNHYLIFLLYQSLEFSKKGISVIWMMENQLRLDYRNRFMNLNVLRFLGVNNIMVDNKFYVGKRN